ncbi:metalloregulator ArsR/SmtB family transcription factor [Bacillus salacetis]|uniref:ArsR/SmtB family transcription factor n=1 Tax=Bacillus salacetis TaxID=2315464 RepID=UPI003B9DEDE0
MMNIEIIFSPFNEMMASLHVLYNPVHHPYRRQWAERIAGQLPEGMMEDIRALGAVSYEWFYFVNIRNEYKLNETTPEEAIEFIYSMPDDAFVYYLLGEQYPMEDLNVWKKDSRLSPLSVQQKDLLSDPGKWKKRIHHFFYEYNEKVFARELFRIQPWIARAEAAFQEKLERNRILALNELHPDVEVDEKVVKVHKGETYVFPKAEYDHITLQASSFVTPHVMLGVYPGRLCLGLHVAVPEAETFDEEPPADLIQMFKALGEATRLKILRDVLTHPYSTKQLAGKYSLSEATVSNHIKVLQQSGLVTSERKGYYIFYSGNRGRMNSLRADLSQFISLPLLEQFIYEADLT